MTSDFSEYAKTVDYATYFSSDRLLIPLAAGALICFVASLVFFFRIRTDEALAKLNLLAAILLLVTSLLLSLLGFMMPFWHINRDSTTFGVQVEKTWDVQAFGCTELDVNEHRMPGNGTWQCAWVSADGKKSDTGHLAVEGDHVGLFDATGKLIQPAGAKTSK